MIGDAPVAHRVILCLPGGPGGRFVDIGYASVDAAQCLLSRLLTRSRGGEKDVEVALGVRFWLAHRIDHLGGPAMHPGPALRRRGRQDNAPYQVRPDESDLLGNEAADREPEDIDASDVQPCNEGKRIASHLPSTSS